MSSSEANQKHIFRKAKTHNYTTISNVPIRDKNLSWKSKGILAYILTLPDDWVINKTHLEKQSSDGRESLTSGMQELVEARYLKHFVIREKGKIIEHQWVAYEEPYPESEKPETGKPYSGDSPSENAPTDDMNQNTGKPELVNPQLLSTNPNKGLKEQQTTGVVAFSEKTDGSLVAIGLTSEKIQSLARQYKEAEVLANLEYVLSMDRRKPIGNKAGYFMSSLEKGHFKKSIPPEREEWVNKLNQVIDEYNTLFQEYKIKAEITLKDGFIHFPVDCVDSKATMVSVEINKILNDVKIEELKQSLDFFTNDWLTCIHRTK